MGQKNSGGGRMVASPLNHPRHTIPPLKFISPAQVGVEYEEGWGRG